jgi:hypothetical protein
MPLLEIFVVVFLPVTILIVYSLMLRATYDWFREEPVQRDREPDMYWANMVLLSGVWTWLLFRMISMVRENPTSWVLIPHDMSSADAVILAICAILMVRFAVRGVLRHYRIRQSIEGRPQANAPKSETLKR